MEDKSIGGFIELEYYGKERTYHDDALGLANGRSCFHLFLKKYRPQKIYLPYYTCNTLIDPLIISRTPYEFYSIDKELEPQINFQLKSKEYILYINYFDVKNKTVLKLEKKYGERLVIDNTQAFYCKGYKAAAASFNSCRKFFGVADGAYLYMKKKTTETFPENQNYKTEHLFSRFLGKSDVYYNQFLENEHTQTSDIASMSALSHKILNHADYDYCKKKRLANFNYLHIKLSKHNLLKLDKGTVGVPYFYPFLPSKHIDRTRFYKKRLFISTLWTDVLKRNKKGFETEKYLSEYLLPLPVDQRYGKEDMQLVVDSLTPHL